LVGKFLQHPIYVVIYGFYVVICLLQRVTRSSVMVGDDLVGRISEGLMVLVGFEAKDPTEDGHAQSDLLNRMSERLLAYRVFPDENDRMNLNVMQAEGGLLLVPQFTLAAETSKGLRPGFHTAASPKVAEQLFDGFVEAVRTRHPEVQTGQFGADMQVALVNNGPVTFWLQL